MFSYCSIIFLVFALVIHAESYGIISFGVSPRADYCLEQGTQCSEDCTAVLYCSGQGAAPIVSVNCTSVASTPNCFSGGTDVATCSAESDCQSGGQAPLTIQCKEAGTFPDPYNCRNSYTCASNNPEPTDQCLCPPGQVWLGSTNECSTDSSTVVQCCQDFSVDCDVTNIGDSFGGCILTSSGYYYICERGSGTTTISLHKCPQNQIWNGTIYKCTPTDSSFFDWYNEKGLNSDDNLPKVLPVCVSELNTTTLPTEQTTTTTPPTEQTTTTTPPTEQTTTTTTDETPTPTPPVAPTCTYYGEVIPVPNSCTLYWVCGDNLVPELRECEENTHLDCSLNGCYCVFGPCPTQAWF